MWRLTALAPYPHFADLDINDLLGRLAEVPESIRTAVRNHGGGHAITRCSGRSWLRTRAALRRGPIADAIARDFGSFARFQALFADAAAKHFGSAWAFLVVDPSTHRLEIRSLPNQDSVVSAGTPALLCCDVWEHAYYLTYRNRRPDYLAAWWSVVAWDVVDGGSRRRHDRDVTAVVCRGTLGPQPRAGQPRHRKVDGAVIRT